MTRIKRLTFPESVCKDYPNMPRSIGIKELNGLDEENAIERASGSSVKLAYELAKQTIVEADGHPVGWGDEGVEKVWYALNAKGRNLLLSAYGRYHNPTEEEQDAFFASMVEVNPGAPIAVVEAPPPER